MIRNILMDDGENQAVRTFLQLYGCTNSPTVEQMKEHLDSSGFDGCWPAWVNDPDNAGHLTKGGAQDWIRHLFSLEPQQAQTAPVVPEGLRLPLPEPLHSIGKKWIAYAQEDGDNNDIAFAIWSALHELSAAPSAPAPEPSEDAKLLDWLDRNFNSFAEKGIPYGSSIREAIRQAIAATAQQKDKGGETA